MHYYDYLSVMAAIPVKQNPKKNSYNVTKQKPGA